MKAAIVSLVACGVHVAARSTDSPVGKVLSMLSDLESKITKEGEAVQKEYAEFAEWCEDRSRNVGFEIKTGQSGVETLSAAIAQESATISSLLTKVDELAAAISTNDKDLAAATSLRSKEAADFTAEEKELVETIDMLKRATGILEKEMRGGASMMQLKSAASLAQIFNIMTQASLIGTGDADRLTSFAQDAASLGDDDIGAPSGSMYTSQSGGVVDALQDLTEKAENQLADTRKKEVATRQSFEMLKQSLEDEIAYASKEMAEAKTGAAASMEKRATLVGNIDVTRQDLAEDVKAKSSLHLDCMSKSASFRAEQVSRGEELKALAAAKKVLEESTDGASQMSFLQVSAATLTSSQDLHRYEAVRLIRDLARKQQSGALVQLASRIASAMHSSDAFEKVKVLITDMISKLEKEAGADATKKAFCDKELAETNVKKSDKSDDIDQLGTKVAQLSAKSAQLKEEVAALESELAKLAKSQVEMDKLRQIDAVRFKASKAELEKGITGVKTALRVLSGYYGSAGKSHDAADGAASGIIGLLEVVEADFSKNLAQISSDEDTASADYTAVSKENEIEKTTKDQDVTYKVKESKQLDKTAAELVSDRNAVKAELDAVLEYLSSLQAQCIAKAESYDSRKERFLAEIAGLKEALQILESETAFVEKRSARRTLRGATLAVSK